MNIRLKIKEQLSGSAEKYFVKDIRIGIGYTAVMLDNDQVGLAYTPHREMPAGCSLRDSALINSNVTASILLEFLTSDNKIETAVGLATANALLNVHSEKLTTGDVLENELLLSDDSVGMVGNFLPITGFLKERVKQLTIFEQIDKPVNNLVPDSEITSRLPLCNVAIITATTIINHSFDQIIDAAKNCREVIILGASTPICPEVFDKTPVTCLSGVIVTDPFKILQIISRGGGMRTFKHCINKVNYHIN